MHLRLHLGFDHTVPYRLVRSTRCAGTEYKGGIAEPAELRYGARARDGWHGELGLACAGTLVSGLATAESNDETRRDETRRDETRWGCPVSGLAVSKRCAFICIYVYMYACRETFVLLLRWRWRERGRMVWYGQNFLLLVRRFSLRM
jgi:hypothetical protein